MHLKSENKNSETEISYRVCEIIKPTLDSACEAVFKTQKEITEDIENACIFVLYDKLRIFDNNMDWKDIDVMIRQNRSSIDVLRTIDDKIEQLMNENSTILEPMRAFEKLDSKLNSNDFELHKEEIINRYVNIFSNILDHKHRSAWTKVNNEARKLASMELIFKLNKLVKESFCFLDENEELDLNIDSKRANNILNKKNVLLEAFDLRNIKSLDKGFSFPQHPVSSCDSMFVKNSIYFPDGLDFAKIDLNNPLINCLNHKNISRNFATGIIYKNLAGYLNYDRLNDTFKRNESLKNFDNYILNSELIGFSFNNIMNKSIKLNAPIRITVHHLNPMERFDSLKCVFFNFTTEEWSDNGCRLIKNDRLSTICECDHLTNFALLMDISGRESQNSIKSFITFLCVILSIIGLLITVIAFTFIPKLQCKRNLITANLCFNLLIVNILIGFFLETRNEVKLFNI